MRYGCHIGVGPPQLRLGQYLFMRWGGAIVFFGRFVALLRILAAVLAGANHFDPLKFLFYNAAGGICWSLLFGLGGYVFGVAINRIAGPIGWLGLAGAVIGAFAAVALLEDQRGAADEGGRGAFRAARASPRLNVSREIAPSPSR